MTKTMSSDDYEQVAKEMRAWLNSQPHLPQDVSDGMLCRFAHSCYYDMEGAKSAADTYFTLRRDYPQLFTDRDPDSPHMKKFISAVNLAHLELSERRKLWIWQLNDPNLEHYELTLDAKFHLLVNDCWFLANEERFYESDIYMLVDFKDIVSIKVFTKLNMLAARVLSKYQREAVPVRLKQLHIVNASFVARKAFALVKKFFSKDVNDMIHFHEANSTTLHNFFNEDELPSDYGGTRPSMKTFMVETMKLINDKRYDKNTN
ncbi:retinaldehyde-binding protein 1-like [Aricia agestis]|uniref:retinaldehyde-binding protein 1-like n=1 Tax=Aricia agestis TaxID=91739 RepID=UPI001C2028AB|nr:retinaldehyde-binding protein 1-like [Aricia agestis]